MATTLPVKMEDEPSIKPDPDTVQQPQPMDEDDDFEDTGELELPPQPENVWLLRVPRVLHEKWSSIDQDDEEEEEEEICIGRVRRGKQSGKLSMMLEPNVPWHEKVERDYDVNNLASNTTNTYVFSEKDLPGFKKGGKSSKNTPEVGDAPGASKAGVDKNKRLQSVRRAIPKQTRLAHVITREFNCMPQETQTTRDIRQQRLLEEERNKHEVKLDMDDNYAPEIQSFINLNKKRDNVTGPLRAKFTKPKPQENKAARMPRNELLDRLFECFGEFKYWSMRALRERLHQPEAYLKENLDSIAELVRSGQFNGNYKLRDDARKEAFNLEVKDEAAPEESDLEVLSGGDDLDMDEPSELRDDLP